MTKHNRANDYNLRFDARRDANEREIIEALSWHGWSVTQINGTDQPDLFIAKDEVTIAVEVKRPGRKLSPGQQRWRDQWNGLYIIAYEAQQAIDEADRLFVSHRPNWYK